MTVIHYKNYWKKRKQVLNETMTDEQKAKSSKKKAGGEAKKKAVAGQDKGSGGDGKDDGNSQWDDSLENLNDDDQQAIRDRFDENNKNSVGK